MNLKLLSFILLITIGNSVWAQKSDTTNLYPNMEHDYVTTNNLLIDLYGQIKGNGASGYGINVSYFFPKRIFSSLEVGWGIGTGAFDYPQSTKNGLISIDIRGGYILFQDIKRTKSMWVVRETSRGYRTMVDYYNIYVPKHRYLIAELGYTNNVIDNLSGRGYQSMFYAPSLTIGLRWKKIRNIFVKVTDKETSYNYSGRLRCYGEIYTGLIIPLQEQISAPNTNITPLERTNLIGYAIFWKASVKDSRWSGFLGLSKPGYNNIVQFTLGVSYSIGYNRR